MLKRHYRISTVEIKTNIAGSKISEIYIKNFLKGRDFIKGDTIFLLYDGDILDIVSKLEKIKKTTLLITNPIIELWFLFHLRDIYNSVTNSFCEQELLKEWPDYRKGRLTDKQKHVLISHQNKAIERELK